MQVAGTACAFRTSTCVEVFQDPILQAQYCGQWCRELAGPADPELAAAAAPGSLRSEVGETGARNALHVTDLEGDGAREAGFFFLTA